VPDELAGKATQCKQCGEWGRAEALEKQSRKSRKGAWFSVPDYIGYFVIGVLMVPVLIIGLAAWNSIPRSEQRITKSQFLEIRVGSTTTSDVQLILGTADRVDMQGDLLRWEYHKGGVRATFLFKNGIVVNKDEYGL
jgi:hypothetical protein